MSSQTDKEPCNCEQSLSLMAELAEIKADMKVLADTYGRNKYMWNSKIKEVNKIVSKYSVLKKEHTNASK